MLFSGRPFAKGDFNDKPGRCIEQSDKRSQMCAVLTAMGMFSSIARKCSCISFDGKVRAFINTVTRGLLIHQSVKLISKGQPGSLCILGPWHTHKLRFSHPLRDTCATQFMHAHFQYNTKQVSVDPPYAKQKWGRSVWVSWVFWNRVLRVLGETF